MFLTNIMANFLLLLHLLLGVVVCHCAQSKKILSVEFIGSKSQVLTYLPLLEELGKKGHQITLVSPTIGLTSSTNITSIFTYDLITLWKELNIDMFNLQDLNPFTATTTMFPKYCRALYDRPELRDIMSTQEFDLILLQPLFNECALGFVHKIRTRNTPTTHPPTPLVLFTPFPAPNYLVELLGGYYPSSFVSNSFIAFSDDMTFAQRFINFGVNLVLDGLFSLHYIPTMEAVYKDKVDGVVPSTKEMLRDTSLILSNSHFSISRPKLQLPNVVDVGGIHSRKARPLLTDLESFISSSSGFILFSLGTAMRSDEMPLEKRDIFLSTFSRLKYNVIWKYESDNIPAKNVPKNVLLTKWMPQQDLLGHPNILLFITHCGGGGTEEAIFHGVPLIGMPFLGDQFLNAQISENHGFLVKLDWKNITKESLTSAILEVINNPKYRTNVQRLSSIFRDQVDSPLDRGVFWLEYVMRHQGAPHLKSPARNLYQFQYHSVDVIAAYLAILFLILFTVYTIIKMVMGWCGYTKNIGSTPKQKTG